MAEPAFRGFVETTLDALLIFEGCKRGQLGKITRRLQEVEKRRLIVSGAVFVFDEEQTGIKRWTDGLSWSPSRTLGNFLVYRELDKKGGPQLSLEGGGWEDVSSIALPPPTPGSMMDRPSSSQQAEQSFAHQQQQPGSRASSFQSPTSASPNPLDGNSLVGRPRSGSDSTALSLDRARERALVGSLTSSYRFRSDGLVKKTISLSKLHMIGYYKIEDVTSGRLRTPSSMPELFSLEISPQFLSSNYFRLPPVTELGPDGKLRYKSEADQSQPPTGPNSVQLIRQNSNPQREVIALPPAQARSRPASSSSSSNRPSSPRSAQREGYQLAQPTSPHRAQRSSNHYHPYSIPRTSPSLSSYPSSGFTYSQPRPSPPLAGRPAFPILAGQAEDGYATNEQSGLSPALGMMSTSSAAQYESSWSQSPSFYQPRHPTPYSTTADAGSQPPSSSIFAYEAPPIGRHTRSDSHHQQQQQQQQPRSRQSPPPTAAGYTYRAPQSSHSQGAPAATFPGHAQMDSSRAYSAAAAVAGYHPRDELEETVPPSSYSSYGHPQPATSYVPYSVTPSAGPSSSANYAFAPQQRPHQPSGMVMGLHGSPADEDEDKPEIVGAPPPRQPLTRTHSDHLQQAIKREHSQNTQWWTEQHQDSYPAQQTGLGLPILQHQQHDSPGQPFQPRTSQPQQQQSYSTYRPQDSWQ